MPKPVSARPVPKLRSSSSAGRPTRPRPKTIHVDQDSDINTSLASSRGVRGSSSNLAGGKEHIERGRDDDYVSHTYMKSSLTALPLLMALFISLLPSWYFIVGFIRYTAFFLKTMYDHDILFPSRKLDLSPMTS